jgi:hypothetical protein
MTPSWRKSTVWPVLASLNRHCGVLRQGKRRQPRNTSEDEASPHKSSGAKCSESYQVRARSGATEPYCKCLTFSLNAASSG